MAIKIAELKETRPGEQRVAMVPNVVERLARLGAQVAIESDGRCHVEPPHAPDRKIAEPEAGS